MGSCGSPDSSAAGLGAGRRVACFFGLETTREEDFLDFLESAWTSPSWLGLVGISLPLKPRRSWLRAQPLRSTCRGPGRHRWALDASPSSFGPGVPIVGPGATVGTVETRVPRAGLPGPTKSSEKFSGNKNSRT